MRKKSPMDSVVSFSATPLLDKEKLHSNNSIHQYRNIILKTLGLVVQQFQLTANCTE